MLSGSPALTERRTRHAIELYHQGYAPILICSGGQKWKISEAERCARRAIRNGVPADAIYLDDQSYSTGDNAANVKAIMDAHGWKTAVMVTDNYHIWRAEWVFKREGVTVYSSPAQTTQPTERMDIVKNSVREFAAISWHVSRSVVGLGY
ncbi:MAG: YdcF family protein, partial [Anaerolineae bacterium]|nr:YdcF family protein [Anaerolineae bacterium]